MQYIFELGHTRIAYIHGDSNRVTRQRLASYYTCMEEHGLTVPEDMYFRDSTEILTRRLSRRNGCWI